MAKQQRWWNELPLGPSEKLRVRQDLTILTNLIPLIEEVEAELCRLSATERWADQVPYLVQRPRIGILIAMVLLSAIGDVTRFPSAKHLVGYAGLGASVHESRANLSHGSDYKAGETGTAYGYGRGSTDSRRTSSPFGRHNSSGSQHDWERTKRLWPLLANSWSWSGMSSPIMRQIAMQIQRRWH